VFSFPLADVSPSGKQLAPKYQTNLLVYIITQMIKFVKPASGSILLIFRERHDGRRRGSAHEHRLPFYTIFDAGQAPGNAGQAPRGAHSK
jgi:hypothetical protein